MNPVGAAEWIPIERHGAVGDRRSGALVAADGAVDWWCLPAFDSAPVFGSLLDPGRGGFCRLAPAGGQLGRQGYAEGSAVLTTAWPALRVDDVMADPGGEREPADEPGRTLIRRMRISSDCPARFSCRPRRNFAAAVAPVLEGSAARFEFGEGALSVWTSFPLQAEEDGVRAEFEARAGEEHWVVVGWNRGRPQSSAEEAAALFGRADAYWRRWSGGLRLDQAGRRASSVRRSAITVQMLSVPGSDCAIAALTTSLPERPGGDRNYDYRYVWIRDASLALALMARLGKPAEAKGFLDWACQRDPGPAMPLQVCYGADGRSDLHPEEIPGVRGYADSRPVVRGNRAWEQMQLGSMGYLLDCLWIYLRHGGHWHPSYWRLAELAANFTCAHWKEPDHGIWELPEKRHYVSSRVMGWVILDRALKIGRRTGSSGDFGRWRLAARQIHADVMQRGWSRRKRCFRQQYESEALDASALLIPLMGFLPLGHSRVRATVEALERELSVNGMLHRFDPRQTCGPDELPLGEFEGAFLPAVFWHAHVLAALGRLEQAEKILIECELAAGGTGLFAEEMDARTGRMLGNLPLLFSHVEYVRAVAALEEARRSRSQEAFQTMNSSEKPRVIVVTGAAAGVGRAAAQLFARTEQAHIGLIARSVEALEGAKGEVESYGGRALVLPCDVADAEAVEAAADRVEAELGPIDVWINVAMTSVFAFIKDTTPEEFRRVTEVCYLGYVYGTLAALKHMRPRNRGHIIQVGSALAYRGIPLQAAYCASKHAIEGFMDSLRAELIHEHSRIIATMVQMPALNTPQFDWCRNKMPRKPQPLPPIYQPEVAAEAIVYASQHRRREIYVGGSTVVTVVGNKLFPRLGDWYLGRRGVESQLTDEKRNGQGDNLFQPVPGDPGAHGRFDARSKRRSAQLWTSMHRDTLAAVATALALVGAATLIRRRRSFLP